MGSGDGRTGESGDDVAHVAPDRPAAQKKTLIAREQDERERAEVRAEVAALDPADLVFFDETSTPTTLTPLRARVPREQRALGRVPRGRREQVTLIAALCSDGITASVLLPGALDRRVFEIWVKQELVPRLRPGQAVLMDNRSVHKSATARHMVEAAGCRWLHLPRYSPDCNPIEQAFAKIKQAMSRAEARTFAALVDAAKPATAAVSSSDAAAFYRTAGYPLTIGQPQ